MDIYVNCSLFVGYLSFVMLLCKLVTACMKLISDKKEKEMHESPSI